MFKSWNYKGFTYFAKVALYVTLTLHMGVFSSFAQLNAEGIPPQEILNTFAIKHPKVEIASWRWDKKFVNYIGVFEKDEQMHEAHISVYGKWVKTTTYMSQNKLPEYIHNYMERYANDDWFINEVVKEKSKVSGDSYTLRLLSHHKPYASSELELTFANGKLSEEKLRKHHHVPFLVKREFEQTFFGVANEKWKFDDKKFVFEAKFKMEGEKQTAYFSPQGEWLRTEREANKEDIEFLTKNESISEIFNKLSLDEVILVSSNEYAKYFKVKLKKQHKKEYLFFSADGNVLNYSEIQ